ncbi:MAG: alpha-L-rhamnosidase C-terminal domain-containing protein, partial [bacterium]
LWKTLARDFGPQRRQTKAYEQVRPANAFIGNIMRLELLSQAGLVQQLLDESLAYQLYMVDRTGTLWENDGPYASCNHGFASHGGVRVLFRDILGLYSIDTVQKRVSLRFPDIKLKSCEGSQPTPDGVVSLKWSRKSGKLAFQVKVPKGYQVVVVGKAAR